MQPPCAPSLSATSLADGLLREDASLVAAGRLDPACASRLYPADGPARGVVLMLHGFTAGPWQYDELGPHLATRNLTGLAARLPGHGATLPGDDAMATRPRAHSGEMPKTRQAKLFAQAARRAYDAARELAQHDGVPLYLIGFSAGGAMALDILQYPDACIDRAVLIAPLVRPRGRLLRTFVRLVGAAPFGGALANAWRLRWPAPKTPGDGWVRPGHDEFALGNVHALFAYARLVRPRKAVLLRTSLQIIATVNDVRIDMGACKALVAHSSGRAALYVFAAEDRVPHAMLTANENRNADSRARIQAITASFLLDGQATSRP